MVFVLFQFDFVREGNQNCLWKINKKVGARAFCSEVVAGDDVMLEPFTGIVEVYQRKSYLMEKDLLSLHLFGK